jgi:hypothetical protein
LEATVGVVGPEKVEQTTERRGRGVDAARRWAESHTSVVLGIGLWLAILFVLCWRNRYVFSFPIRENGDFAANSLLVNQATHFQLLVGNYSRVGFHHPGPAFLYVQAVGQVVFYSFLHLVPAQYNGQLVAVYVLNAAFLALVGVIIYRHARSVVLASLAVGLLLLMTGGHLDVQLQWASSWMPSLYVAPFILTVVAGVSVACGAMEDIPALVVGTGFLIHGHVSFVGIAGGYVVLVVVAWRLTAGREWRHRLKLGRRNLIAGAIIAAIFALPMFLDLVLHWPGQWVNYWHYLSRGHRVSNSVTSSAKFVASYWPGHTAVHLLFAGLAVVTVTLALRNPNLQQRRFSLGCIAAVVATTLLVLVYTIRGVDDLTQRYIASFYYTIPPLVIIAFTLEVGYRVTQYMYVRVKRSRLMYGRALAGITAVLVLVVGFRSASFLTNYQGDPHLSTIAASIKQDPQRQGREVALVFTDTKTSLEWPTVAGMIVAAQRDGYAACAVGAQWALIMTPQFTCNSTRAARDWQVLVLSRAQPISATERVIWSDSSTVIAT